MIGPIGFSAMALLLGHWQQECVSQNRRSETFQAETVTYSEIYYADTNCEKASLQLVSSGPYSIDLRNAGLNGSSEKNSGVFAQIENQQNISIPANGNIKDSAQNSGNIDFEFADVNAILWSQTLVDRYNQKAVCGIADWQIGQIRNISGLACDLFGIGNIKMPKVGDKRFGIWKLENDSLYFGQLSKEHDGTTPNRRPLSFNPRAYLRK